jgi:NADPH-dependent 2,4-dienoyl-CoA reductase/sulfur reductase-like enzyme
MFVSKTGASAVTLSEEEREKPGLALISKRLRRLRDKFISQVANSKGRGLRRGGAAPRERVDARQQFGEGEGLHQMVIAARPLIFSMSHVAGIADAASLGAERQVRAMNRSEVLIVGAGPTGLVLALWLAKLGVKVRIVGTADGIEPEVRIRPQQVGDWATAPDSNQ